jgi:hypothetical protein
MSPDLRATMHADIDTWFAVHDAAGPIGVTGAAPNADRHGHYHAGDPGPD